MWNLWWTQLHWDSSFPKYLGFPKSVSLNQCSLLFHLSISDMVQSLPITAWLNYTHHLSTDVTCSLHILPNHKMSACGRLSHVMPYQVAGSVRCWKGSSQHHVTQLDNVTKQTSVPLQHICMSEWIWLNSFQLVTTHLKLCTEVSVQRLWSIVWQPHLQKWMD